MKAIDLYKFVHNHNMEYHWHDNDNDVILFVELFYLQEFNKLIGPYIFDDEGISCTMKDGYLCIMMQYICEHHDIELNEIFDKPEK